MEMFFVVVRSEAGEDLLGGLGIERRVVAEKRRGEECH